MIRKYLLLLVACLALLAASCSTGGGDDDAGDGDQSTTTEASGGEDGSSTTEPGGGDDDDDDVEDAETTTTEAGGSSGGGSGGDSSRDAYVDAMTASLLADDTDMGLSRDQAECVGESWVDIFGADRLSAAGITPDDIRNDTDDAPMSDLGLSASEAEGLVDTFGSCGIDLTKAMVDSMAEDQTLTPEDRACLENAFNEDFLRRLFVVTLTEGDDAVENDPELLNEMMAALFACPGAMGLNEGDLNAE